MKVLILHPNFPAQYKHIARALGADSNNEVIFVTKPTRLSIPNVKIVTYQLKKEGNPETHRYVLNLEKAAYHGQAVWRVCNELKNQGFGPDIICAHPGWGSALFVKDLWPRVPLLNFCEFYYRAFGADVNYQAKEEPSPDDIARIRIKNANNLLNLEACDWGICPTYWQYSVHPIEFYHKMFVLHDGIDTELFSPLGEQHYTVKLPDGTILDTKKHEIVTYTARNFEPYRGLETAIQAIDILLKERPNCHFLIDGNEGVSYGKRLAEGEKSYLQQALEKVKLDEKRVHFLGRQDFNKYLLMIKSSQVHLYLTLPFVLSWSFLEAMSTGCAVVASSTKPVLEVIKDGFNGLLADFYSPDEVAKRVSQVLDHPDKMQAMRNNARQTILEHYALDLCLPKHLAILSELASGQQYPPTITALQDELALKRGSLSQAQYVDPQIQP